VFHTIVIVGNLGRDPEMRYMPDGRAVTNLSVATNRTYSNASGEQVKETVWFRVSVFGKQAESCNQYLAKGRMVLVEGRLQPDKETGGPRVWAGQDGAARASFEVVAQTVRFLGRGDQAAPGGGGQAAVAAGGQGMDAGMGMEEDEIPF
jgi:single-strand DNA-binding protein